MASLLAVGWAAAMQHIGDERKGGLQRAIALAITRARVATPIFEYLAAKASRAWHTVDAVSPASTEHILRAARRIAPRYGISVLRMCTNGLFTSSRMHETSVASCLFCRQRSSDVMTHILLCEEAWITVQAAAANPLALKKIAKYSASLVAPDDADDLWNRGAELLLALHAIVHAYHKVRLGMILGRDVEAFTGNEWTRVWQELEAYARAELQRA